MRKLIWLIPLLAVFTLAYGRFGQGDGGGGGTAMTADAIAESLATVDTIPGDHTFEDSTTMDKLVVQGKAAFEKLLKSDYRLNSDDNNRLIDVLPVQMDWTNSGYSITGATLVAQPYIMIHDDTIYVFYEYDAATWKIGLAYAADFAGPWTVIEPLLSPRDTVGFPDGAGIADPTVLYIPWAQHKWHMWFDMYDGEDDAGDQGWTIGHAWADDPKLAANWTKQKGTNDTTKIVINQSTHFDNYDQDEIHCPEAFIYGNAVHLLYGCRGTGHTSYDAMLAIANDYHGLGYSFEKWGPVTCDNSTIDGLAYRLQSVFNHNGTLYAILHDYTKSPSTLDFYWVCSPDGGKTWQQIGRSANQLHSFAFHGDKLWGIKHGNGFYYLDLTNVTKTSYDSTQIGTKTNLPIMLNTKKGYCVDGYSVLTRGSINLNNTTAGVDTALYIKHYGSQTTDRGIVFDMDTSLNTAANVVGIDFSGSNAFDASTDYYIYMGGMNYWRGDGTLRASSLDLGSNMFNFMGSAITYFQHNYSYDMKFQWVATTKGDIIFKDGNLATGTVNLNFIQVQDSAGAANLNIPNKGIRGHLHFGGNCLVDTVVIMGVTDNSFVFLTWKGTAAPTSPLAWKYHNTDSILVYCAIADSTAARVSGYTWFRVE